MTKHQAITFVIKKYSGLDIVGIKEIKEGFVVVLDRKKNRRKDDFLLIDPLLIQHTGKVIPYNPISVDNYNVENIPNTINSKVKNRRKKSTAEI